VVEKQSVALLFTLTSDVLLHGPRRYPIAVGSIYPALGEARFYRNVGLWQDGTYRCNLVLASVAKEPWAVLTDEPPTLQTLWYNMLRFQVEVVLIANRGV